MGKPENGTILEPTLLWENHEPGGSEGSLNMPKLSLHAPGVSYQA